MDMDQGECLAQLPVRHLQLSKVPAYYIPTPIVYIANNHTLCYEIVIDIIAYYYCFAGALIDWQHSFVVLFLASAVASLLFTFTMCFVSEPTNATATTNSTVSRNHAEKASMKSVWAVLRRQRRAPLLLYGSVAAVAIVHSGINSIGPVLVSRLVHDRESIVGFLSVSKVSLEIPMFISSGLIIRRVGFRFMSFISLACLFARSLGWLALYAFALPYWVVFLIEPLQGITFASLWSTAVHLVAKISPPGLTATAQNLLHISMYRIGSNIGAIMASWVVERYSSNLLFLAFSGWSALLLCVFIASSTKLRDYFDAPDNNEAMHLADDGSSSPEGNAPKSRNGRRPMYAKVPIHEDAKSLSMREIEAIFPTSDHWLFKLQSYKLV